MFISNACEKSRINYVTPCELAYLTLLHTGERLGLQEKKKVRGITGYQKIKSSENQPQSWTFPSQFWEKPLSAMRSQARAAKRRGGLGWVMRLPVDNSLSSLSWGNQTCYHNQMTIWRPIGRKSTRSTPYDYRILGPRTWEGSWLHTKELISRSIHNSVFVL